MTAKQFFVVDGPSVIAVEAVPIPAVAVGCTTEPVPEGHEVIFNLTLTAPTEVDIEVDYATEDGTAVAGVDYVAAQGVATITAGDVVAHVLVPTTAALPERDVRTFALVITNARAGAVADVPIAVASAVGTITKDVPVVQPPGDGTAYFNQWAAHPAAVEACTRSLQSQEQLDAALSSKFRPSRYYTHDPANDPSPRRQDATRLMLRAGQTKPPLGHRPTWYPAMRSAASLIFVWDMYADETWVTGMIAGSDMTGNKTWRFYRQGGHSWWAHMWSYRGETFPTAAVITDEFNTPFPLPNGMTHKEGVAPCGEGTTFEQYPRSNRHYAVTPNCYHRFITEVRYLQPPEAFTSWNHTYNVTVQPNPNDTQGRWHMVSKWAIREGEDVPTRLLYQVPMGWSLPGAPLPDGDTTIGYVQLQYDTSQDGSDCPERWCYHRGLITLRDYALPERPEDDRELFAAPLP